MTALQVDAGVADEILPLTGTAPRSATNIPALAQRESSFYLQIGLTPLVLFDKQTSATASIVIQSTYFGTAKDAN